MTSPRRAPIALALACAALVSGLLAGTVAEGVDPSTQAWGLNLTGWILISAPFLLFVIGTLWGSIRQDKENVDAVADLVS